MPYLIIWHTRKVVKSVVFTLRVNQNTMYKCYPESYGGTSSDDPGSEIFYKLLLFPYLKFDFQKYFLYDFDTFTEVYSLSEFSSCQNLTTLFIYEAA